MPQTSPEELAAKDSVRAMQDTTEAPQVAHEGDVTLEADQPEHDGSTAKYEENLAHFRETLESAERLLLYSASIGVEIDDATRDSILKARAVRSTSWNQTIAANLLAALAKLAARLKPVSAESLKACSFDTRRTVRGYWVVAICLAAFIVPVSVATFVTSAISDAIRKDVTAANEEAVKLTAQLESSAAQPPVNAGSGGATSMPAGLSESM